MASGSGGPNQQGLPIDSQSSPPTFSFTPGYGSGLVQGAVVDTFGFNGTVILPTEQFTTDDPAFQGPRTLEPAAHVRKIVYEMALKMGRSHHIPSTHVFDGLVHYPTRFSEAMGLPGVDFDFLCLHNETWRMRERDEHNNFVTRLRDRPGDLPSSLTELFDSTNQAHNTKLLLVLWLPIGENLRRLVNSFPQSAKAFPGVHFLFVEDCAPGYGDSSEWAPAKTGRARHSQLWPDVTAADMISTPMNCKLWQPTEMPEDPKYGQQEERKYAVVRKHSCSVTLFLVKRIPRQSPIHTPTRISLYAVTRTTQSFWICQNFLRTLSGPSSGPSLALELACLLVFLVGPLVRNAGLRSLFSLFHKNTALVLCPSSLGGLNRVS